MRLQKDKALRFELESAINNTGTGHHCRTGRGAVLAAASQNRRRSRGASLPFLPAMGDDANLVRATVTVWLLAKIAMTVK